MKTSSITCCLALASLSTGLGHSQVTRTPGASTATSPTCGMTAQQADQVLIELKEIHKLLENMQRQKMTGSAVVGSSEPQRVKMEVAGSWFSIGRTDAPVTIVEFIDYQCPFCKRFHAENFAELKTKYIDTGKVRFVSRDLPLEMHQNARAAAESARCAGDQGKFWEIRDAFLKDPGDLTQENIASHAALLALDMNTYNSCIKGGAHKSDVQSDSTAATALGVNATPTFVIGRTASDFIVGDRLIGAVPISVLDSEIQALLTVQAKP